MIKQFTNDKGVKYLFVEVPVDAYDFVIRQADRIYESHNQVLAYKTPFIWEKFKKENWIWNTRSEQLNFIGLSKDLTEEQCNGIVDECDEFVSSGGQFEDYSGTSVSDTALESWQSLIKHLGFKETDNIAILKTEN